MIRNTISRYITEAVRASGYRDKESGEYTIEHPPEKFGDFATNVAIILARDYDQKAHDIATNIIVHLREHSEFSSVEIAGPGFINITLSKDYLLEYLKENIFNPHWGHQKTLTGKKLLFEHTDPNPFKEMHIGHLMSNSIGESLARIAQIMGASVTRICYQGDVGLHTAKALWALQKLPNKKSITKEDIGKAYAQGAKEYEKNPISKREINALNKLIYEGTDREIMSLYEEGKSISLRAFEDIYKRIDVSFDKYIFESEVAPIGQQLVEEGLTHGVFNEDNGAVVFNGGLYEDNLHTRVFINAQGLPTYEAKELGLGALKHSLLSPDVSYIITANETVEYMKVVMCAARELKLPFVEYTNHLPHGFLKLSSGKMSSRTGDVITAESLLNTIRDEVLKRSDNKINVAQADTIATAAIRYSILRQGSGNDVIFDMKQSLSLQGDSGVYILYTYVRLRSIMRKSRRPLFSFLRQKNIYPHLPLIRLLYQYEEVVARAWETKESTHIVTYLTNLSSTANSWYAKEKILNADNEREKVNLAEAVAHTLKQGLHLLGIGTVEQM